MAGKHQIFTLDQIPTMFSDYLASIGIKNVDSNAFFHKFPYLLHYTQSATNRPLGKLTAPNPHTQSHLQPFTAHPTEMGPFSLQPNANNFVGLATDRGSSFKTQHYYQAHQTLATQTIHQIQPHILGLSNAIEALSPLGPMSTWQQ